MATGKNTAFAAMPGKASHGWAGNRSWDIGFAMNCIKFYAK